MNKGNGMNAAIKDGKNGRVRSAKVTPVKRGAIRELWIIDDKGRETRLALTAEIIDQIKKSL